MRSRSFVACSCFFALNLVALAACDDAAQDGKGGAGGATSSTSTSSTTTSSTSTTTQSTASGTSSSSASGTGGGPSADWSLETGAYLVDIQTANDGGLYVYGNGKPADLASKTIATFDPMGPGYVTKLSAATGAIEWSYLLPAASFGPGRHLVTSPTGHVAFDASTGSTGLYVSLDPTGAEAWKYIGSTSWVFPDFDVNEQVWTFGHKVSAAGNAAQTSPIGFWGVQVVESNLVYFGAASVDGVPELRAFQLDGTTSVFSKTASFTACNTCRPDLNAAALTSGETILYSAVAQQSAGLDPNGEVDWGCGQSANAVLGAFSDTGDCLWSIPYADILPGASLEPSSDGRFLVSASHALELRSAADGSVVETWAYPNTVFVGTASPYHPAVHVMEFALGIRTLRRLQ